MSLTFRAYFDITIRGREKIQLCNRLVLEISWRLKREAFYLHGLLLSLQCELSFYVMRPKKSEQGSSSGHLAKQTGGGKEQLTLLKLGAWGHTTWWYLDTEHAQRHRNSHQGKHFLRWQQFSRIQNYYPGARWNALAHYDCKNLLWSSVRIWANTKKLDGKLNGHSQNWDCSAIRFAHRGKHG